MSKVLPQIGLVLFLGAVLIFSTGLLHAILVHISPELAAKVEALGPHPAPRPQTSAEQDQAVELARKGKYDEALAILAPLYQKDPTNSGLARDYTAVLSWAGHDQEAVALYQTLPPPVPNYVVGAAAHSYREIGQYDKALAAYKLGLDHSPTNVGFAEGEIRTLIDMNNYDEALAVANKDIADNGNRPEIVAAKSDITTVQAKHDRDTAVNYARNKQYTEALTLLSTLRQREPANQDYVRDYLAVLDWQGGHDQEVTDLYKTLPGTDEPDYVLGAVGHAYRNLKQPDLAFVIFQQGAQHFPNSVSFVEGEIRALGDQKKYDDAIALADQDLSTHGDRAEIVAARNDMIKWKPKPKPKPAAVAKKKKAATH